MKSFLMKVVFFTSIVVVIAIIADYAIGEGLKKTERGHFYTMNILMNDTINADVIVLGNSRAAFSYNPYVLDTILNCNSQNLGISGQPFGVSYLRWKLYRRNNKPPKILIINVDYGELEMVSNGYEKEQYYPYIKDELVRPYLDLYGFSFLEKNVPMYRYRGDWKLLSIGLMELFNIRHDSKGDYYKGFSNKDWNWEGEMLDTLIKEGEKIKCACNPQAIALLDTLLQQAKAEGVKTFFVYAPLYTKVREIIIEDSALQEYRRLSEKYDIPLLDFSDFWISKDTDYFHDGNHVNLKGANVFSEELAQRIKMLL